MNVWKVLRELTFDLGLKVPKVSFSDRRNEEVGTEARWTVLMRALQDDDDAGWSLTGFPQGQGWQLI